MNALSVRHNNISSRYTVAVIHPTIVSVVSGTVLPEPMPALPLNPTYPCLTNLRLREEVLVKLFLDSFSYYSLIQQNIPNSCWI